MLDMRVHGTFPRFLLFGQGVGFLRIFTLILCTAGVYSVRGSKGETDASLSMVGAFPLSSSIVR